jgi:cytochrome P450
MGRRLDELKVAGSTVEQLKTMRTNRIGAMDDLNARGDDIARFGMIFGHVVVVNTPELVHEVLVSKVRAFAKSPVLRGALHPLAGEGLFTSEGELWKRQRKIMAPLFSPAAIGAYATAMTDATERALSVWRDGDVVDAARETTTITMAIAGLTLFDADTFEEADELGAALTTALDWAGAQTSSPTLIVQARAAIGLDLLAGIAPERFAPRLRAASRAAVLPVLWPGKRSRELKAAIGVLEGRVTRMIEDRRAKRNDKRDLLSFLLAARDEDDGSAMSDRQIRDEILTLFVAGHETTANALAWALMLLAQHPDILAKVRAEADAIGRTPTAEDAPRLPLALAVFKEALRLYPAVYMFGRVTTTDVQIGEWDLPKGTVVLVGPYALHRKPSLWRDPLRFDPSRFTPEEEAKRHKLSFLPFGAGPRTCIGNHFALLEGPLVLATILRHAELELLDPRGAEPEASATLRPKNGIPMRVTLRRREATTRPQEARA